MQTILRNYSIKIIIKIYGNVPLDWNTNRYFTFRGRKYQMTAIQK